MTLCLLLYQQFLALYGHVQQLYRHVLLLYGKSAPLYINISQLYQQFPSLYHIVAPLYGRFEGLWGGAVLLWRKVLLPFHAAFLQYGKNLVLHRMDLLPFGHFLPGFRLCVCAIRDFPAFYAPDFQVCVGVFGLCAGAPQVWGECLATFPLTLRVFF